MTVPESELAPAARETDVALAARESEIAPDAGERATPYYCPYCADEDLRPHGETGGAWHCRGCARVFTVRFVGLETS